jgi:hypothetical protein
MCYNSINQNYGNGGKFYGKVKEVPQGYVISIHPTALNISSLPHVNMSTYTAVRNNWDIREAGWNGASSRVNITNVAQLLTDQPNNNVVMVVALPDYRCPFTGNIVSGITLQETAVIPGGIIIVNRSTIVMNSTAWVWNHAAGDSDAIRAERYRHTFLHEVGHVLLLDDIHCNSCRTVMRQGIPSNTGGPSLNTPYVAPRDVLNLRAKWGN